MDKKDLIKLQEDAFEVLELLVREELEKLLRNG